MDGVFYEEFELEPMPAVQELRLSLANFRLHRYHVKFLFLKTFLLISGDRCELHPQHGFKAFAGPVLFQANIKLIGLEN